MEQLPRSPRSPASSISCLTITIPFSGPPALLSAYLICSSASLILILALSWPMTTLCAGLLSKCSGAPRPRFRGPVCEMSR
ncbi:uncharacterized protein BCR38DRAFT_427258 [Pseudomassariella vexata]|uniref:Uncharacterized protein n=1 Tax=Pseudomassariella vexata TaxID=1141098 RepID=A0A1Y2E7I1_9PEZI|nr:uncharacterized protein BCR38DRAFT_427258 [Pseudomassariella vexata]ORY67500.1 hypothetical protein BCR38DRAFT_427258 [Pseudomassariella vexata]